MAVLLTKTQIITEFDNVLPTQQRKGGVCITYFKMMREIDWASASEIQQTYALFRKEVRKGNLIVRKENNEEYTYKGRKFYSLVIQDTKRNGDHEPCPIMLLVFKNMVSGFSYFFTNKENRDKMFNWLMKSEKKAKAKAKAVAPVRPSPPAVATFRDWLMEDIPTSSNVIPDPPSAVKKQRRKRKRCQADDPPQQPACPPTYANGVIDYPTNDPPPDNE